MATTYPPATTPSQDSQESSTAPTAAPPNEPYHSKLEDFELESDSRPPYILSRTELKLLGIAGVRPLSFFSGHTTSH